ncbi:hypothetical protein MRX96_033253 [Rhipicephalus microplus]
MLKLATGRALGNSSKFVASRNYTSIECGATAIRTPARSRGLVNWAATPATTSTGQRRRTMKERPPGAPNRVEKAARTPIRRQGAPGTARRGRVLRHRLFELCVAIVRRRVGRLLQGQRRPGGRRGRQDTRPQRAPVRQNRARPHAETREVKNHYCRGCDVVAEMGRRYRKTRLI